VTVDLGNIMNSAVETTDEAASKIEVKFEMLALLHDNLVVGNTYTVSVGAIYQSESFIDVAQDELTYQDFTPQTVIPSYISLASCALH